MPNKKITAFNYNNTPTFSDIIPIVNNNETKQISLSGLTDFIKPYIDVTITGGTYLDGTSVFTNNNGETFSVSGYTTPFTGGTVSDLTAGIISATTYHNLPIIERFITGTYAELTNLVNSSGLTVSNHYILTDYKTIYQINGSNSRDNTETYPIIGSAGIYSQFDSVPNTIASNGDAALCVYAPSGASVTTGQSILIDNYFNDGYISFWPRITGTNNIGVQIQFSKQRYSNIPSNIIINDINGKPVLKPYGVLNTEVHDGTPYMSMDANENTAVKTESLILTAIDSYSFSRDAESLTYPGDKLTYDFLDNKIYDENGNQIGIRNGSILKRTNLDGSISINKDWREQKYRRYKLDDTNWNGFILNKSASGLSGTSGSTIYSMGGVNFCTTTNTGINADNAYLLSEPYGINIYTDLAKSVSDPFISGTTSIPTLEASSRFNLSNNATTYSVDVSLPLYIFSGLTSSGTTLAKDFTILPLENNYPTNNVLYIKVNDLSNTIFTTYPQRYGLSQNLSIISEIGGISNSTFLTSAEIDNTGTLDNIKTVDAMYINNSNIISNVNFLANGGIYNHGTIYNSSFGNGYVNGVNDYSSYHISSTSIILNSIFGCNRVDTFIFDNFNANTSIFINRTAGVSNMSGKLYLTQYKNNASTFGSEIKLNTFVNQKPNKGYYGYVYDFGTNLYDLEVNNFNYNKNLVYENIDATGTTTIVLVVSGK